MNENNAITSTIPQHIFFDTPRRGEHVPRDVSNIERVSYALRNKRKKIIILFRIWNAFAGGVRSNFEYCFNRAMFWGLQISDVICMKYGRRGRLVNTSSKKNTFYY